jgi:hypothetical protein
MGSSVVAPDFPPLPLNPTRNAHADAKATLGKSNIRPPREPQPRARVLWLETFKVIIGSTQRAWTGRSSLIHRSNRYRGSAGGELPPAAPVDQGRLLFFCCERSVSTRDDKLPSAFWIVSQADP